VNRKKTTKKEGFREFYRTLIIDIVKIESPILTFIEDENYGKI